MKRQEIKLENVLAYNAKLYADIDKQIGYGPVTREIMKITLERLKNAMLLKNVTKNKARFFEVCLENV